MTIDQLNTIVDNFLRARTEEMSRIVAYDPFRDSSVGMSDSEDLADEIEQEEEVEEDRPSLADRLEKAEGRERELIRKNEELQITLVRKQAHVNLLLGDMKYATDRAERAEAMAQKLDLMGSDLEKCRKALGDVWCKANLSV